jgi:drug/metabolite transporter (DMT)-like permease
MWRNVVLIVVCMLVSDWANVFLKLGATKVGFTPSIDGILRIVTDAHLIAGFVLYGAGMLLWLTVLAQNRFSAVIIIFSIHYIHLMLLARYVFKEPITWNMWAGTIFVMLGVGLYSGGGLLVKQP